MDGKVKVLTQDREESGNPGLRLWWGVEGKGAGLALSGSGSPGEGTPGRS